LPYSCISRDGIVEARGAVMYPSPLGLVRIGEGGSELLTEALATPEQWRSIGPETMRGFWWQGRYIGFSSPDGGVTIHVLAVDPFKPEDGIISYSAPAATAGFSSLPDAHLYIAAEGKITQWDSLLGQAQRFRWKSRPFPFSSPRFMGVLRVLAVKYPVDVAIYRDGFLQARVRADSPAPRRVLNAELGREYQIEVTSVNEVLEIVLASTMNEIKQLAQGG